MLDFAEGPELTIAAGAITVTHGHHAVDTESDAAFDDLDTINGGVEGMVMTLQLAAEGRTVELTGAGNIVTNGAVGLILAEDRITLRYDGSSWREVGRSMGFLGCLLSNTGAQSVPDSTFTEMAFDTEDYDIGGWFDPGSSASEVVVPRGVYRVQMGSQAVFAADATGRRIVRNLKGGALTPGSGELRANAIGFGASSMNNAGMPFPAAAGDVLTTEVWQNSGADLDLNAGVFWLCVRAVRG
jgi:hypothetical protein